MPAETTLRICGITFRLSSDDGRFLAAARRRYAPFAGRGREDLSVRVETMDAPVRRAPSELRTKRSGDILLLARYDLLGCIDADAAGAQVRRTAASLDGFLRVVLSDALLRRGGFLCHAAAVDGVLLPGRSGAGKTTFGRKVPRPRLLSDELVGVLGGRLHATPFWGEFRAGRNSGSRKLRLVAFPDRRAPRGRAPLARAEALTRLLECVVCYDDGEAAARRAILLAARCVKSVPCVTLSYDARRTAWRELERLLRRPSSRA